MSAHAAPGASDIQAINFSWLVRLRWGAIAGQVFTILAVDRLMRTPLPLGPLFTIVGLEFASNIGCAVWSRRGGRVPEGLTVFVMSVDVLLLSALLYLTGGPFNPFSFLYLVQIALAAVVLRARWTWALVVLSLLCSGFLFFAHRELPLGSMTHAEHSAGSLRIHLYGMWVAFGVAAAFIVYFLLRITRALAAREAELQAAYRLTARNEKLASLATLAAGAAHELSTPLSTIALVARELERQLSASAFDPGAVSDVRLIREQVERCRAILAQMATEAGATAGEAIVPITVTDLLASATLELGERPPVRVEIDDGLRDARLELPPRAVAQAIRGVIRNAQDASPADAEVVLHAQAGEHALLIEVRDCGTGMAPEVLARAGEPFFTTKQPGRGMGLGLFLTRAVLERLGGQLQLESAQGRGTRALVRLPLVVPAASPS
ncbi:MAG TPA: ATP-binding protein [Polyangia bacterium]|nr:ATP-binding protein [Polyangia bacterium]